MRTFYFNTITIGADLEATKMAFAVYIFEKIKSSIGH